MTDSTRPERHVAQLARARDEDLTGLESGTAARTLLASILAEPVHRPRPAPRREKRVRRMVLATAVVAAVTVAVAIGPSLLGDGSGAATSYANSAIDVTLEGEFLVARIKDPLADHARYAEAFRAVGKDVDIELVPVSPSMVGLLLEARSSGGSRNETSTDLVSPDPERVACDDTPASCVIVLRISADTDGASRFTLGRAARPGESYHDPAAGTGDEPPESSVDRDGSGSSGGN